MTRSPYHLLTAALALVLAAVPCASPAQEVVQPLPGTTDADKLGDMMRRLAANPRDVDALIRAGDLSMGLGDLSGAAALFARAEKVNPRDGRTKAGMASILVRSERPGEALRYYAQAESLGLDPRTFAADRGLAYDLIGQQDRAQRDYRVALRDAADDETLRRYALSLGISGKQDLALQQLAPLLQKSDRGAWRARAFIMAMNGDVSGAEKIATTMMPSGTAQGLQPFFQRLPTLPAADRAFAVHFGEVHATSARLADARMTPPLPALGADPTAPVMLAATSQPQPLAAAPAKKKSDRKARPGRTEMAATAMPTRSSVSSATVAPPQPAPVQPAPVQVASAPMQMVQTVPAQPAPVPSVAVRTASPSPATSTSVPPPVAVARAQPVPGATGTQLASAAAPVASTPVPAPQPAETRVAAASTPAAAPTPIAPAPVTPPVAVASTTSEDSILARIIAGLSIPASELDVAPMRAAPGAVAAAAPVADDTERLLAEAKAKAARDLAVKKLAADALAAEKKAAADKKIADRKAAADKKALAAKKAAAAEKVIADKKAAEEKRIARANPERIWVQVSTGATEGDLPRAWRNAKAKAPTVFGARAGWTAPWNATNRVLAGPFKTTAEARTFVNQLAKEGVSTFTFTSDAGQVISKLPAK